MSHHTLKYLLLGCALLGGCGRERYACQSKQGEVKSALRMAADIMSSAHEQRGAYPATIAELRAEGFGEGLEYYDYEVISTSEEGFVVQGSGKGDMAGDVWRVERGGEPSAVTDRCQ